MRFLSLLPFLCVVGFAQNGARAPFDALGANLPAQPIGPNDLLSVSVYDSPELSRTLRVSSDGHLKLPMMAESLNVLGKLPVDLETLIADAFVREKILVSPVITVNVTEYHSRPITVSGAVKNPLTFQSIGPTRLLDAIGRAGGLAENASAEVLVTFAVDKEGDVPAVRRVLIRDLMNATDPALNVPLSGGEAISVPAARRVFIMGNVKKPGAYSLREASEGTVLQMLALAEGLTLFSTKSAYIYRLEQNGSRTEVLVQLDLILKRKSPDVTILADDILYVPDDKGRRVSMAVLERLLVFGSTAGATALIYGGSH